MPEPTPRVDALPARRPAPSTPSSQRLGAAKVLGARGADLLISFVEDDDDDAPLLATPAFTFPYRAQQGDELLVLGQGDRYYAVGVITGARPHALTFPGDVTVSTVDGRLTLASDRAVELRAPRVTVRAGVLRTIADRVVEKADELRRWVRGLMAVRAGESRRIVDGLDSTRCENSTTLAKDTVKIDGDQLHLGH